MIYDIRHVTTYGYESPVSFARCSLRLEPKSGDGQQLISHSVEIRPRPADRNLRRDFFGTLTESILIETAHRNLRIDSRSRVSVSRRAPGRTTQGPAWENVRDVAFAATSLGPASPIGYIFASPLVPVLEPVTGYAALSFPPAGGVLAGAVDLMHRIRNQFKYDPKATVISTPLKEVFEKRTRRMPGSHYGAARGSAGSASTRPTTSWSRTITSSLRWDVIFPMSRRSTALSLDRASKSSASRWMCCWWNEARLALQSSPSPAFRGERVGGLSAKQNCTRVGKGALCAVPTTDAIAILNGGHASAFAL